MKLAYIAHPYRSTTIDGLAENIWHARKVAKRYWQRNYAVICPCLNSAFMDGVMPDKTFLDGDLAILAKCDLLVLSGNWLASTGCVGEKIFAEQHKIQIEYFVDDKWFQFQWHKG